VYPASDVLAVALREAAKRLLTGSSPARLMRVTGKMAK